MRAGTRRFEEMKQTRRVLRKKNDSKNDVTKAKEPLKEVKRKKTAL